MNKKLFTSILLNQLLLIIGSFFGKKGNWTPIWFFISLSLFFFVESITIKHFLLNICSILYGIVKSNRAFLK
jgi:hypothetical protein